MSHKCQPPDAKKESVGSFWDCECGQRWKVYVLETTQFWREVQNSEELRRYMEQLRRRLE